MYLTMTDSTDRPCRSEADTRAKFIDSASRAQSWIEELVRHEETTGTVEIIGGKARWRSRGQVKYHLIAIPAWIH